MKISLNRAVLVLTLLKATAAFSVEVKRVREAVLNGHSDSSNFSFDFDNNTFEFFSSEFKKNHTIHYKFDLDGKRLEHKSFGPFPGYWEDVVRLNNGNYAASLTRAVAGTRGVYLLKPDGTVLNKWISSPPSQIKKTSKGDGFTASIRASDQDFTFNINHVSLFNQDGQFLNQALIEGAIVGELQPTYSGMAGYSCADLQVDSDDEDDDNPAPPVYKFGCFLATWGGSREIVLENRYAAGAVGMLSRDQIVLVSDVDNEPDTDSRKATGPRLDVYSIGKKITLIKQGPLIESSVVDLSVLGNGYIALRHRGKDKISIYSAETLDKVLDLVAPAGYYHTALYDLYGPMVGTFENGRMGIVVRSEMDDSLHLAIYSPKGELLTQTLFSGSDLNDKMKENDNAPSAKELKTKLNRLIKFQDQKVTAANSVYKHVYFAGRYLDRKLIGIDANGKIVLADSADSHYSFIGHYPLFAVDLPQTNGKRIIRTGFYTDDMNYEGSTPSKVVMYDIELP